MEKNFLILHGHFYQPPRENPWTGFIDRQPSAYPYNDWNSRINTECYASCSRTLIWDEGHVAGILNCYEYLSFNCGPTLLSWMDNNEGDMETLKKIVEADRISMTRNAGHGNAIAQIYNHMIMPLANEKDQYTQILWGLHDFRTRFGRDSEGIWLSETAINNETAAILVDCGIKFVILSPFQASKVIKNGQEIDVLGGKIDPSVPYKLKTKNGDLAVFFYDPHLASEISFGTLLSDSQKLYSSVLQAFQNQNNPVKLVHTATDGEVYGHHKAYGNMALARMVYDIVKDPNAKFQITNYGRFLSDNPPTQECILHLGDDGKGSSWSCAHGVGRWFRDCGCHTGGSDLWNQKWRTPLREAFDYLRDQIHIAAETSMKDVLSNVWDARNEYINLIFSNNEEAYKNFFEKHQVKELTSDQKKNVVLLMESMHYAMLMYTSCGWFFSDVSGIETVQDMLYAYRAYEFAKPFLSNEVEEQFVSILSQSQSNVDTSNNGKLILNKAVGETQISTTTLREYVYWFVLREGINGVRTSNNEFNFSEIWEDQENDRYMLHFRNKFGLDIYTAFGFIGNEDKELWSGYLIWKDISVNDVEQSKKDEFWKQDSSWNISYLKSLPLVLRVRFMSRGIQYEMIRGYRQKRAHGSLSLEVVWGAESLLLPYEKRILLFYYASQVYSFAQSLAFGEDMSLNIESFLKEAELLKKSSATNEEANLYLEPVVLALEVCLKKSLYSRDAKQLKNVRTIFVGIKNNIAAEYFDVMRDIVYEFYKANINTLKDSQFIIEFNTLMKSMEFVSWMIDNKNL
ncbi:MAG: DUF3536 domain-containing protein [Brevinemataceae bacterium]